MHVGPRNFIYSAYHRAVQAMSFFSHVSYYSARPAKVTSAQCVRTKGLSSPSPNCKQGASTVQYVGSIMNEPIIMYFSIVGPVKGFGGWGECVTL